MSLTLCYFKSFKSFFNLSKVYALGETNSTSYAGHAFGALAGLLIGVFVLVNRRVEDWEVIFKWIAFAAYGVVVSFATDNSFKVLGNFKRNSGDCNNKLYLVLIYTIVIINLLVLLYKFDPIKILALLGLGRLASF